MDSEEFFYGITLTGANATHTWDASKDEEEATRSQRLVIKNLLLGHEAKADEYSVVEAQAPSASGEVVKIPIAVLKVGETRSMNPHLEFPDGPVTFKLISGAGPVHLHGLVGMGGNEEDDMDDEAEMEEIYPEEEEEGEDEEAGGPKKKIKLAANNGKAAANNKKK